MKTAKELKKEVDKILGEKVSLAIKDFQAERDQELAELTELSESLERCETEKEQMSKELSSLNLIVGEDQRRHRELSMQLRSLEKDIESLKERSGIFFTRLTFVPALKLDDYPFLNLLLSFMGK
jgi:chromosome segregation ATPase